MGYFFQNEDRSDLIQEVSPMQALEYEGIDMVKSGSNFLILCPNPEHNDHSVGSCVVLPSKRRCHCYACDREITSYNIIKWTEGLSHYETMCRLAELSGHPQDYEAKRRKKLIEKKEQESRLSSEQLDLIGLKAYGTLKMVTNASESKPKSSCIGTSKACEYLVGDRTTYSIYKLQSEEPEVYQWLIRNKCKEKMLSIQMLKGDLKNPDSSPSAQIAYRLLQRVKGTLGEFLSVFDDMLDKIEDIYYEYGGKSKNPIIKAASTMATWESFSSNQLQTSRICSYKEKAG